MLLLLIDWSKCGSHFANSFSMSKYSCTICSKRFFDIFRVYQDQVHFTIIQIILWTFCRYSSETASFRRLLCASPSIHISPSFNLANHFATVDFAGAEYKQCLASQALASTVFFLAKKQCFTNPRNSFYPSFHNIQKLLHSKCYISQTNYPTAFKFIHVSFEGWYFQKKLIDFFLVSRST
jgi:hypothetical protein